MLLKTYLMCCNASKPFISSNNRRWVISIPYSSFHLSIIYLTIYLSTELSTRKPMRKIQIPILRRRIILSSLSLSNLQQLRNEVTSFYPILQSSFPLIIWMISDIFVYTELLESINEWMKQSSISHDMQPDRILFVHQIPITLNGKVDIRQLLLPPDSSDTSIDSRKSRDNSNSNTDTATHTKGAVSLQDIVLFVEDLCDIVLNESPFMLELANIGHSTRRIPYEDMNKRKNIFLVQKGATSMDLMRIVQRIKKVLGMFLFERNHHYFASGNQQYSFSIISSPLFRYIRRAERTRVSKITQSLIRYQ